MSSKQPSRVRRLPSRYDTEDEIVQMPSRKRSNHSSTSLDPGIPPAPSRQLRFETVKREPVQIQEDYQPLDVESVEHEEERIVEQLSDEDVPVDMDIGILKRPPIAVDQATGRVIKARRRKNPPENIDYEAIRYYDRYKNQDYARKNDISKYCHVCRQKVTNKTRSIPTDHRLRRLWILRFNLTAEHAGELWVKDAFMEGHTGEACSSHFPVGTDHMKSRDLLPIDMRPHAETISPQDDECFDFDMLEMDCVFCDDKATLNHMIPFSRTRCRRYKWIEALSMLNESVKSHLKQELKMGATKFLCDWHFSDNDFDINGFGEWRLRKDAHPDPTVLVISDVRLLRPPDHFGRRLRREDRRGDRVYLVDHLETVTQRNEPLRMRREDVMQFRRDARIKERFERQHAHYIAERLRRTYPVNMGYVLDGNEEFLYDDDYEMIQPDGEVLVAPGFDKYSIINEEGMAHHEDVDKPVELMSSRDAETNGVVRLQGSERVAGNSNEVDTGSAEQAGVGSLSGAAGNRRRVFVDDEDDALYSEDSDEENEVLARAQRTGYASGPVSNARFCQVCARVVSSEKSMKLYRPRVWPFDDVKHERWLEIMNWPKEFEDSMRILWTKRSDEVLMNILRSSNRDMLSIDNKQKEYNWEKVGEPTSVNDAIAAGVGGYHYCPINVCQSHLDYRNLHQKVSLWLSTYCVLCDEDLKDPNLLVPFPFDRTERVLWMSYLTSVPSVHKILERRWRWLRDRMTRRRPTRYRVCIYHFEQGAFVDKDDCIEFDAKALPLPLGLSEYDTTPRGPHGWIKCPLCDIYGKGAEMVSIRTPASQAERIMLVELLNGDKNLMKKGIEQMLAHPCKICRAHLPPKDPYLVIAERKLVNQLTVQCIQCSIRDLGSDMIPFPDNPVERKHWVDAMAREFWTRQRLLERLNVEGRHYLCAAHFHKNSLRYIPGLGVWKKYVYLPLAVTPQEKERIQSMVNEPVYNPLIIADLDVNGVAYDVSYETVSELLGEPDTFANDPHFYRQTQEERRTQDATEERDHVINATDMDVVAEEDIIEVVADEDGEETVEVEAIEREDKKVEVLVNDDAQTSKEEETNSSVIQQ